LSYRLQLGLLLAPFLCGLVLLVVIPVVLATAIAFSDFDALSAPEWVGLNNFAEMLQDGEFWNGIRASAFFLVLALPLRIAGALSLALLLQARGRLVGLARAAVFLPSIIPDVAYALLWLYIFNPLYGPLNGILGLFVGAPVGTPTHGWLLHQTGAAEIAVVIMLVWTIGEGFVLMLAALHDISPELYEAAAIDGASFWQRVWRVTVPMLAPYLVLLAFRDTVWSFQANFVAAVIVTEGGPYYATTYLPYWIYLNAADFQRFGYAAAMTLVMFAITGMLITLQFVVVRRWRAAYYA
jgi:multiple sugar transport system permease protein